MTGVREGLSAVFGEHRRNNVCDNVQLRLVRRGNVDEDIPRVERDLAMLGVDNRGHGQYDIVLVVDDRVHGRVPDDGQVTREVLF